MVRGGAGNWPLRLVLVALCAVVPWLAGPWYALAAMLALPVLRALLDAIHERFTAWICIAGACVSAALLLPGWLWPAMAAWGVGLVTMSALRLPAGSKTIYAGAALATGTGILALALAAVR